eukprot:maker-scaffold1543_size36305-snap-gene-0.7 protein:Tk02762 transcript:maker-scaffold1543_size36305-snap-gene-0.7-mRNA-1 annotation:"hypothetical protein GUITHDRAFT_118490"
MVGEDHLKPKKVRGRTLGAHHRMRIFSFNRNPPVHHHPSGLSIEQVATEERVEVLWVALGSSGGPSVELPVTASLRDPAVASMTS